MLSGCSTLTLEGPKEVLSTLTTLELYNSDEKFNFSWFYDIVLGGGGKNMGSPLGFETPFSCRNIWAEYSCWTFNAMMFFATQITSQPYLPLPSVFYITCRTSQSFWLKNFKISEKSTNFFSKISEPKIGRNLPTNKENKKLCRM